MPLPILSGDALNGCLYGLSVGTECLGVALEKAQGAFNRSRELSQLDTKNIADATMNLRSVRENYETVRRCGYNGVFRERLIDVDNNLGQLENLLGTIKDIGQATIPEGTSLTLGLQRSDRARMAVAEAIPMIRPLQDLLSRTYNAAKDMNYLS